jgi:hypothetical protein
MDRGWIVVMLVVGVRLGWRRRSVDAMATRMHRAGMQREWLGDQERQP